MAIRNAATFFRTSTWILLAIACLSGCNPDSNPSAESTAPPAPARPIRVAVIDDRELASAIDREWHASAESEIEVINLSEAVSDSANSVNADVIIFAASDMGQLMSITPNLRIRPLQYSSSERQLAKLNDIMPLTRQREMVWGKELTALTIGSPQFCLFCRSDLFELLDLKIPTTWSDYQKVVAALTANENQTAIGQKLSSNGAVVGECMASGWAAKSFLLRAAAYAKNPAEFSCLFSIADFSPRIATPPFERALNELRETLRIANDRIDTSPPHELMERLLTGQLAMVLSWPTAWRNDGELDVLPLDIGTCPGSDEFYNRLSGSWSPRPDTEPRTVPLIGVSGRFAAISAGGNTSLAKDFLIWLATPGNSLVTSRSSETVPFRKSQRQEISQWLPPALKPISQQYFDILESNQAAAVSLTYPRFVAQKRYLAVLDQAVHESLTTNETSIDVLTKVAAQWEAITEELGRDAQLASYLQSLNINHSKR